MTHRRLVATACVVVVSIGGGAIACRQLVGIGDDPPRGPALGDAAEGDGGPACGVAYRPAGCEACVEQSCCAQASACHADPTCNAAETCLAGCAGDPRCRAQCGVDFPVGGAATVPVLDQCLAASCAAACGIQCGGAEYFFNPDAAASCASCGAGATCASSLACTSSLECQEFSRCVEACRTADCNAACSQGRDAGYALFLQSYDGFLSCRAECEIGDNWSCVGSVGWPIAKGPNITLTAYVILYGSSSPVDGVAVKMCGSSDTTCAMPVAQGTTADGGRVDLVEPGIQPTNPGLDGYLDLSSPAILSTLYFWSFPLSEPSATFLNPVFTFAPTQFPGFLAQLGETPDPASGQVVVLAVDCFQVSAPNVQIAVTGADGGAVQGYYLAGALPSRTATATDATGLAGFPNVAPGLIDVVVTPVGLGKPSSHVTALVRPNTLTFVSAPPTPSP
jgi:hypothetical protein